MAIQTTLVGSYPVPEWLRVHASEQAIEDALRVVYATQEEAGIDLVTDGELSRFDINDPDGNGMIEYFVRPLKGVRAKATREDLREFSSAAHLAYRRAPAGVVFDSVDEGFLDLPGAARRARSLTRRPYKFTVTSPYMLGRVLLDRHYGDLEALTAGLAQVLAKQVGDIDADVVQIDEANLPGRPEDWPLAAEAINTVMDAVSQERALHLCLGNYGGNQTQKGGSLGRLVEFIERLRVGHVVLETARTSFADLEQLRDLKNIGFGIGVIDVKDMATESPDCVAGRIESAVRILSDPGRIAYVHPDCGLWMLPRAVADRKIRSLVAGRDLFEGRT